MTIEELEIRVSDLEGCLNGFMSYVEHIFDFNHLDYRVDIDGKIKSLIEQLEFLKERKKSINVVKL